MKLTVVILSSLMFMACASNDEHSNPRFNHTFLYVSDADRSAAFYEEAFGMQKYKQLEQLVIQYNDERTDSVNINITLMRMPGYKYNLEFAESPVASDSSYQSPHFQHIGIEVDDIEVSITRALKAGAVQAREERLIRADDILTKTIFFYGPDKELIELMEILEGDF